MNSSWFGTCSNKCKLCLSGTKCNTCICSLAVLSFKSCFSSCLCWNLLMTTLPRERFLLLCIWGHCLMGGQNLTIIHSFLCCHYQQQEPWWPHSLLLYMIVECLESGGWHCHEVNMLRVPDKLMKSCDHISAGRLFILFKPMLGRFMFTIYDKVLNARFCQKGSRWNMKKDSKELNSVTYFVMLLHSNGFHLLQNSNRIEFLLWHTWSWCSRLSTLCPLLTVWTLFDRVVVGKSLISLHSHLFRPPVRFRGLKVRLFQNGRLTTGSHTLPLLL